MKLTYLNQDIIENSQTGFALIKQPHSADLHVSLSPHKTMTDQNQISAYSTSSKSKPHI